MYFKLEWNARSRQTVLILPGKLHFEAVRRYPPMGLIDAGALNHVDYTELYRAGRGDEMLLKFNLPEVQLFRYLLTYLSKVPK